MRALWLNGGPVAADELAALALVNYGHFTSLQVRGGAAQGLDLHLQRLQDATRELFDATLDEATLRVWMRQAAAGGDVSLRVTVFARDFDRRMPEKPATPDVLVAAAPPAPMPAGPMTVASVPFVRPAPHLKHVGTFPLFHQMRLARRRGFDDALFVDGSGPQARVLEGSIWNAGFWDGEGVVWPEGPALRGTAERLLQEALAARGVPQATRPVALSEVGRFRGAFACNSAGVRLLAAIDAAAYRPTPELAALLAEALAGRPWTPL
ncbi:MAG TPA: aminotransferase class IV [Lysobacter sp.]|nr:aminotransferase class IV [Lysobacter sp.]